MPWIVLGYNKFVFQYSPYNFGISESLLTNQEKKMCFNKRCITHTQSSDINYSETSFGV